MRRLVCPLVFLLAMPVWAQKGPPAEEFRYEKDPVTGRWRMVKVSPKKPKVNTPPRPPRKPRVMKKSAPPSLAARPRASLNRTDITATELRSAFLAWKSQRPKDQQIYQIEVSSRQGDLFEVDGAIIAAEHDRVFGKARLPASSFRWLRSGIRAANTIALGQDLTARSNGKSVTYNIILDHPSAQALRWVHRPVRSCVLSAEDKSKPKGSRALKTIPRGMYKIVDDQLYTEVLKGRIADFPVWFLKVWAEKRNNPDIEIFLDCIFPERFFSGYRPLYGELLYLLENTGITFGKSI